MFYLILPFGILLLFMRRIPQGRGSAISLGLIVVLLLGMWGSYMTWSNPSGDPQGSMFRGVELLVLLIVTALLVLVAWAQTRPKGTPPSDTAPNSPRKALFFQIVPVLAAAVYLAMAYAL